MGLVRLAVSVQSAGEGEVVAMSRRQWLPWVGTAARLLLAGVWIAAGWLKLPDPDASVRAVRAYDLLPEALVSPVGYALPVLEIALGLLLLVGLGTRIAAMVSAVLLVLFIIGIASAWARGLQIECGCFGDGGYSANAADEYPWEIARDLGLLAASALLVVRPVTALSLDGWLLGPTRVEEKVDA
jgi:uncharacterized membrane protein YphA (DoxX/SURF4 family)